MAAGGGPRGEALLPSGNAKMCVLFAKTTTMAATRAKTNGVKTIPWTGVQTISTAFGRLKTGGPLLGSTENWGPTVGFD